METRVFDITATVLSIDGKNSETFTMSDQVKNVQRFDIRVMFEPVSTYQLAGTYAMEWSVFEAITTSVRGAKA